MKKKEFDEESPGYTKWLKKAIAGAGKKARQEAFDLGLSVMIAKEGKEGYGLYYDNPDGSSTFIRSLPKPSKTKKKLNLD